MSTFKGTPGPWEIHNDHVYAPGSAVGTIEVDREIRPYRNNLLALVYSGVALSGCREANTALIAQAPAMLQALVDCEPFVEYLSFNGNEQAHEAHKRIYAILAALREGGAL